MDRRYDEVAAYYGFECTGYSDNCCLTRFYTCMAALEQRFKKRFDFSEKFKKTVSEMLVLKIETKH